MASRTHQFYAIAFEENLSLRQLAPLFPNARISAHELYQPIEPEGGMYVFPFGAVVLYDVPTERREAELARLYRLGPKLTTQVIREDYSVLEDPSVTTGIADGMLRVDKLTPARAGIVALTMAQSAAMEYYERIVDQLFTGTASFIEHLERRGTVPVRTRPLLRFVGQAISTRVEVLSVLHLLDKPDAAWDDPAMDRIYNDLRAEFDLVDRYRALELKLRSVQESLELLAEIAQDRRVLLLEVIVIFLILLEVVIAIVEYRKLPGGSVGAANASLESPSPLNRAAGDDHATGAPARMPPLTRSQ
jgi:required for meiotic nuclear division protein 1